MIFQYYLVSTLFTLFHLFILFNEVSWFCTLFFCLVKSIFPVSCFLTYEVYFSEIFIKITNCITDLNFFLKNRFKAVPLRACSWYSFSFFFLSFFFFLQSWVFVQHLNDMMYTDLNTARNPNAEKNVYYIGIKTH